MRTYEEQLAAYHECEQDNRPPERVFSIRELHEQYEKYAQQSTMLNLDLANWIPEFREHVRPLLPGELMFILAATGVGKSMILQNIAAHATAETCMFFEFELPKQLMFERFAASVNAKTCSEIEEMARVGKNIDLAALHHVYVCDQTRLTSGDMERVIEVELKEKIGSKPLVVFVDYIGLMGAKGASRYERMSVAAEDLKALAKQTGTIIVAATQAHRPEEINAPLTMHSAKDSGSIENSAGLLIGAERDPNNPREVMVLRILKNTKGSSGGTIRCKLDGSRMRITQETRDW